MADIECPSQSRESACRSDPVISPFASVDRAVDRAVCDGHRYIEPSRDAVVGTGIMEVTLDEAEDLFIPLLRCDLARARHEARAGVGGVDDRARDKAERLVPGVVEVAVVTAD